MNKEELKNKIISANKAYRSGTAIMTDSEFDSFLDSFKEMCTETEFKEFVDTLHEVSGKVKHPYVLGSLNKLKASEPETYAKFVKEHVKNTLNISAKIDGLSCRLHYEKGKLTSASTRGDGSFGVDLTDKTEFIKKIPQTISTNETLDIRGELVILKADFLSVADEFANPRNAVAGIINRKEWTKEDVSTVTFVAYTILGPKYSKQQQFEFLEKFGFFTAWHIEQKNATIEQLTAYTVQEFPYENDGLVLSDSEYHNEDQYRPDAQVAFKINQQTAVTTILDVVFDGPSKNGIHCPVAILDPVELGGVMVSRVTLHNLDYIEEMNLQYGSKVEILRSGDVIPRIMSVVEQPKTSNPVNLPLVCNCCGEELVRDGVHLRCKNKNCKDQVMHRLAAFIVKLGVKGATEKTLENFGICSYSDLLEFVPNEKYKSQTKLSEELSMKLFTRSKQDLFAALNIQDVGETLINKIVDFYGFENIEKENYVGFPSGIGQLTLDKFKEEAKNNLEIVKMIISDKRYNFTNNNPESSKKIPANGQSICFTGKLNTMGRSEAEKKAIEHRFEIKGVSKNLTFLVTNDPNTNSGKGKKARELGIKIISEQDFLTMIADEEFSSFENL